MADTVLNLESLDIEQAIVLLYEIYNALQGDEVLKLRGQLGIDIDRDPDDDIIATSGPLTITNKAGIAAAIFALRVLDGLDSTPGDGLVEFRQEFKYKLWGLIRGTGEGRERILPEISRP